MPSASRGDPLVSVIIPTRGRPRLVVGAVASALEQTLTDLEVLVVLDGPDPATEEALAAIDDRRLRVVGLPRHGGKSAALNRGVDLARGVWVAFLDDDDEWWPSKLQRQHAVATASVAAMPVVSCQAVTHTASGPVVWPKRFPRADEHLSDYLLDRPSPFGRTGAIAHPTIFAPRRLFELIPFASYVRHEDYTWLLAACQRRDVCVEFVRDPLCTIDLDLSRPSLSRYDDWST